VGDLLSRWRELRSRGQGVSAEDLCGDRPDLLERLRHDLRAVEAMEAFLGPDTGEVVPPAADGATLPSRPEGSPGAAATSWPVVPGHEILGELGRGGMGVVYQARQLALDRLVALKMVLAGAHAGEAERVRFKVEAEAVARLQHPNVVQIHEVGEAGGLPYFSLEFCPGGSLEKRLQGTPLPAREAAALVETLARAMNAAHGKGIVHRDLKPANVLLGEGGAPKITDFGLAKRVEVGAGLTATGAVLGTPSYMAPEQAGGKGAAVSPAADVYALGAILYECLTGRPPFKAATPLDTLLQVVSDEPVAPRQLQSRTPRDLETIALKCLQKEPGKRYASALELAEDLRRFQAGEPIRARPVGSAERAWRWCRRNPLPAAGATAIGLALATGIVLAVLAARSAQAVAAAEKENARKDQQRLREALFEQARAERLVGNRHRALELLADAARTGSGEELRQEAIQAVTSSGVRFVREVNPDWEQWGKGGVQNLFLKQLAEYAFPEIAHDFPARLAKGTDGRAELVWGHDKLAILPPHLGLPTVCGLSSDRRWLVFRDATEPDLIRIWDCRRRLLHGRLPACGDLAMIGYVSISCLSAIAFSPDGVLIASTHARGGEYLLQINEIDSKRSLITRDGVGVVRWSPDGKFLLTCSRTSLVGAAPPPRTFAGILPERDRVNLSVGYAQIWEVSCPVPTYQVGHTVERLRFRADGRQLAVNDTVDVIRNKESHERMARYAIIQDVIGHEVWRSFSPVVSDRQFGL
jgi:hypothetical protein